MLYFVKLGALGMVVRIHWVVGGSIVCDEEGPASPVTVIPVTAMEKVRVEKESIASLHLDLHQRKYLSKINSDRMTCHAGICLER